MANVSVRMYATVREAAGTGEVDLAASDLAELFERLSEDSTPALRALLKSYGQTEGGIVVLLNGRNVADSDPASLALAEGDEVAIFPPVSGG